MDGSCVRYYAPMGALSSGQEMKLPVRWGGGRGGVRKVSVTLLYRVDFEGVVTGKKQKLQPLLEHLQRGRGAERGGIHQYHSLTGFYMQSQANFMPQTTPDGRQTRRGAVHGLRVTWGWLQHMPARPRPPWYRCWQPWQPFLPNFQPLPYASMSAKKNRAHTFGCAGAVRSSHSACRALAALSSLPRRGRDL